MTETTYRDYIPANARVVVDYTQPPKQKVKFSYPEDLTYEQALKKFGRRTFSRLGNALFWFELIMVGAFAFGYLLPMEFHLLTSEPNAPTSSLNVTFSQLLTYRTYTVTNTYNPLIFIVFIIIAISYLILELLYPSIALAHYKNKPKRLAEIIPTLNYELSLFWNFGRLKYLEIEPKDIHNNAFLLEAPFQNIYLDYKATGDIARELQKVEVLEYKYGYRLKYKKSGRIAREGKPVINHYDWFALFKFGKTPKTGTLELEFI
jgi:hypothetical protein